MASNAGQGKRRPEWVKGRAELTLRMTGALQRSPQSGFGPSVIIRREWAVMVSSARQKKKLRSFRGRPGQPSAKKMLAAVSQQVFDLGKRRVTGVGSGRDQLGRLHKLIPQHVVHVGFDEHVGKASPGLIRYRLNNRKRAADHFNRVARFRIKKPWFQVHCNHEFGAEFAHGRRGNLLGEEAIYQEMVLVLD